MKFLLGVFMILHAVVHLIFAGHTYGFFDLELGVAWPDNSRILSGRLGAAAIRRWATIGLFVVSVVWLVGGVAILRGWPWAAELAVASIVLSSLVYLALWDGKWGRCRIKASLASR